MTHSRKNEIDIHRFCVQRYYYFNKIAKIESNIKQYM